MVKKIDEKLITISKLQCNFRQKKLDYANFLSGNQLDLPLIANVMVSFPTVRKERVEIKNSQKRRNIIELDRYF
jgi:hypothetical protein